MVKKAAADMDELLSIDIDSLSIEEIETIEEIIDAPMDSLAQPGARKGKMMRAMAVVLKRRTDPNFSIEDAGRLRISLKSKPKDPTALSA
ncbi:hypothetical protein ACFZDG_11155 [Kitasatospora xanthocidica]|uniref:hypothetical protein n=1 Tax=Kitasatospora xanthocidica TaxID=83382 RepID=UPI0036E7EC36